MPVSHRPRTFNVQPIHPASKLTGSFDRILRPKSPHASPLVHDAILILSDIWTSTSHIQQQKLASFTTEVLRRCQFSKQLLETALYFLVKIKPHVEESTDLVLKCPRKTFLAALILAGKYCQDRPFSMQAWSKISGLTTDLLVSNELSFLKAVNWDLFIPHHGLESLSLHLQSIRRNHNHSIDAPFAPAVSETAPGLTDDEGSPSSDSE